MDVLTVTEAARVLKVTPALIRIYIQRGLFPGAEKVRGTRWKIPRAAVELFDGTNVAGVFRQKTRAPFCNVAGYQDISGISRFGCFMDQGKSQIQAFDLYTEATEFAEKINRAAEIWAKGTK